MRFNIYVVSSSKPLELNFFGQKKNSYGLAKLAIFEKFSTFLLDLKNYVEINYWPDRPHFRMAFFTSYNFFFGCLDRWFEKVGQIDRSLTSPTIFRRRKNQRLMFLVSMLFFPSQTPKVKVFAHRTSNIFHILIELFS